MRPSRFNREQILAILKQSAAGLKTAEIARQHGISQATFYKWKVRFGSSEVSEARRLNQLVKENGRLKQIVAELLLANMALKDSLAAKSDGP